MYKKLFFSANKATEFTTIVVPMPKLLHSRNIAISTSPLPSNERGIFITGLCRFLQNLYDIGCISRILLLLRIGKNCDVNSVITVATPSEYNKNLT
jgi:hypothetical protein